MILTAFNWYLQRNFGQAALRSLLTELNRQLHGQKRSGIEDIHLDVKLLNWLYRVAVNRGGSRKFRKRGLSPPPSPLLSRMETSLFRRCIKKHCGVFLMQSKVTLTFRKIGSKIYKTIFKAKSYENTGNKRGAAAPPRPLP